MPPRVDVRGVEFIEFAASDEEAQALGSMLTALGFVPTAQHRRKAVTRWQQGDINIVMNCEPEGLAHSFDAVHGASVCALGLQGRRTCRPRLARAEQLAIPRFMQAVGPDELQDSVREGRRRQPHLFHRGRQRGGGVAARVHAARADRSERRARCSSSGRITSRRRCNTRSSCPGSSTTSRCSTSRRRRRSRSPIRSGSCRARPSSRRIARCASR